MPGRPRRAASRGGFSLVEVSIALFVVGIGVVSIMGLFPAGLDMSKRSIDDTYASFLADSAFTSFRGVQMYLPWDEIEQYETIPPNTINRGTSVFWNDPDEMKLFADGQIRPLRFVAGTSQYKWESGNPLGAGWSQLDHAMSYRLTVSDPTPRIKGLRLEIWANEFTDRISPEPEPDAVFYTELFHYGL